MNVRAALGAAVGDFYRQSWRLVLLNAVFGVMVVAVTLAALAARPAVALAVLIGPVAAALMHCSLTLVQTDELRLGEALIGLRRYWRRGLTLAGLLTAVAVLGLAAVPFYARLGVWGLPLAALTAYLVLAFFVLQLALWPLAILKRQRPIAEVSREALTLVLRRPVGFAGLGLALLVVNAVGLAAAAVPFLTLTIAYSFLVSAHFALPNPAPEVEAWRA
jgi:hypothetical protein